MSEEILQNPVTGETLYIVESTPESFKVRYSMAPHSEIPGEHYHPTMTQTVSVLTGAVHFRIDGQEQLISAGESAKIPPGARHFQWNPSDEEVVAVEEHNPAGQIHDFFKVIVRLAEDGQTTAQGVPTPLMAVAVFSYFKETIRPEPFAFRLFIWLASPLARVLGLYRRIDRYLEPAE